MRSTWTLSVILPRMSSTAYSLRRHSAHPSHPDPMPRASPGPDPCLAAGRQAADTREPKTPCETNPWHGPARGARPRNTHEEGVKRQPTRPAREDAVALSPCC